MKHFCDKDSINKNVLAIITHMKIVRLMHVGVTMQGSRSSLLFAAAKEYSNI